MAVSVEPPEVSERLRQKLGADFTFVSDENGELLDRLNVRHREGGWGSDVAFPTALLVDRYGIVRWVYEMQFGHMRMTPEDLFEAMERLSLEEQNRELVRSRAVSKVVRQVFLMKEPEDLGDAIDVMREELKELGLGFSACGFAIMDRENGSVTAFGALPRRGGGDGGGALTTDELSVADAPEVKRLIEAWKNGEPTLLRFAPGECSSSLCRMSPAGRAAELRWLLNVPFSHGTVFVGDSDSEEPTEDDIRTLIEFADAISVAYQRFIDFRELEHRNRQLQETQLQLIQSEKMASLGQLVAGVAHEVNTPMGAIHSNTQSARKALEHARGLLESQKQLGREELGTLSASIVTLRDMNAVNEAACRRIIQIVDNLRKFARLDESEWQRVDLRESLEETLALVEHQTRERIEVVKRFEEIPPVACYASQVNQVFMNLLVNAIQAIEGSGRIEIETFHDGDEVSVKIADDGHGIPREALDRIFDPGYTTKGVGVGMGLGLSICYQIMRNHGGRLDVESEVGKGSTFTVILPLGARPPEQRPSAPSYVSQLSRG